MIKNEKKKDREEGKVISAASVCAPQQNKNGCYGYP
jgi:hypothetical protein